MDEENTQQVAYANQQSAEERLKLQKVIRRVTTIFEDGGEEFTREDAQRVSRERTDEPGFPLLMVGLALFKDLLDGLQVTGILLIITIPVSFIVALILLVWVIGKMSGGWWKKKMIRWLWMRYLATAIIELLPGFSLVPATTIFILMAHYREKKLVQLVNRAFEEFRRAGLAGTIR